MTLLNSTTFVEHTKDCLILGGAFECDLGLGEGGGEQKLEITNLQKFKCLQGCQGGMLKLKLD